MKLPKNKLNRDKKKTIKSKICTFKMFIVTSFKIFRASGLIAGSVNTVSTNVSTAEYVLVISFKSSDSNTERRSTGGNMQAFSDELDRLKCDIRALSGESETAMAVSCTGLRSELKCALRALSGESETAIAVSCTGLRSDTVLSSSIVVSARSMGAEFESETAPGLKGPDGRNRLIDFCALFCTLLGARECLFILIDIRLLFARGVPNRVIYIFIHINTYK
jgi:hypothetical protein